MPLPLRPSHVASHPAPLPASPASFPPRRSPHPDGSALCRIYTKGASEIVLERCSYVLAPDGTRRRLGDEEKAALLGDFTQGGQR